LARAAIEGKNKEDLSQEDQAFKAVVERRREAERQRLRYVTAFYGMSAQADHRLMLKRSLASLKLASSRRELPARRGEEFTLEELNRPNRPPKKTTEVRITRTRRMARRRWRWKMLRQYSSRTNKLELQRFKEDFLFNTSEFSRGPLHSPTTCWRNSRLKGWQLSAPFRLLVGRTLL
jgi:hypothetical protein